MQLISNKNIVYIVCPANNATGGPEALHQLGSELIKNGITTYMLYFHFDSNANSSPVHPFYENYKVPYTLKIENDSEDNLIIFPETFCVYLWNIEFVKAKKLIWWLSVTNFFISLKTIEDHFTSTIPYYKIKRFYTYYPLPSLKNLKKLKVMHLAHSYFSFDFLKKNKITTIGRISDYMNSNFLSYVENKTIKENIIIYNPVKNDSFLDTIKLQTPNYNWIAIKNFTPEQVSDIMNKAKVYIDFGYHPGKERMPREALLKNCCLIIGKDGSAKYKEDMPILDEFHFSKKTKNIPSIINAINICMNDYEVQIKKFESYQKVLFNEKDTFSLDVKSVFLNN